MATESLIIELDAKTAKLDAGLKKTEDRLAILEDKTKKTDSSFKKLTSTAGMVAGQLAKVSAVVLAVGTAITAMTLKAASSRKELEGFARQAKTSAEDFQALSFATSQYGINAEKIADISKDISDKVGEFAAAGTGTFQDYADVMKLTKDEARTLAIEFQSLSSEEVIGKMVSEMEAAGTSGAQMTFVLESMGSDLSKLLPLYKGNSKELLTLKKRFTDVNDSLQITGIQAEKLKAVSVTYGLLTSQLGNAATAVSATIAPVMDEFFNDIIEVVPDATQSIIDFINSFLDAENITSVGAVNKQIKITKDEMQATTELMENQKGRMAKASQFQLNADARRLADLEAQLVVLKEQELSLENANRLKGGEIGGEGGGEVVPLEGVGTGDEIQAIADRFKDEEQLLTDKLNRELEIIGENDTLKEELHDEYLMNIVAMDQRAEDDKAAIKLKADKTRIKTDDKLHSTEQQLKKQNISSIMAITGALVGHDSKIGKALFLGTQALALSETFVNTQAASIKALTIDPTGILSAKVQTAGNISMAAIAATTIGTLSSSSGGGGVSGGSTSAVTSSGENNSSSSRDANFEAETTGLQVTDATDQGSSVQTIRFAVDSGDELIDAISSALNKANNEGR